MTEENFKLLKEYLDEELNFDPTSYSSMQKKISKIPNLLQRYLTLYIEEKEELNNLEFKLKENYASLYHKYKFPDSKDGLSFQYQLDTKNEINLYVEGNPSFIAKSLAVQKQKLQVEFLEKSLQNIKDMLWALKYALEQRKFFEGAS